MQFWRDPLVPGVICRPAAIAKMHQKPEAVQGDSILASEKSDQLARSVQQVRWNGPIVFLRYRYPCVDWKLYFWLVQSSHGPMILFYSLTHCRASKNEPKWCPRQTVGLNVQPSAHCAAPHKNAHPRYLVDILSSRWSTFVRGTLAVRSAHELQQQLIRMLLVNLWVCTKKYIELNVNHQRGWEWASKREYCDKRASGLYVAVRRMMTWRRNGPWTCGAGSGIFRIVAQMTIYFKFSIARSCSSLAEFTTSNEYWKGCGWLWMK